MIVVDGAPLLESDLSQFVVQSADAPVVVARDRRTLYSHLRAGVEFLYRSPIRAFTAVVTASAPSPIESLIKWKDDQLSRLSRVGLRGLFRPNPGAQDRAPYPLAQPAGEAV